ncbi:hypothetical protein BC332_31876 [Capsicum chinense]|nr:hypothetical protein BC332_31876 [Capsicum chinense]
MKQIVKILTLLLAVTAVWIGLLQTSTIPESYTWLFIAIVVAVASLPHCVPRLLWSVNGWRWSDEFSYMSSRGSLLTAGGSNETPRRYLAPPPVIVSQVSARKTKASGHFVMDFAGNITRSTSHHCSFAVSSVGYR